MVRFENVEVAADLDHAVPGAVRLEIVRLGIRHRVTLQERAQICDQRPRSAAVHSDDGVRNIGDRMRATSAGKQRIERVSNERDICHSADQTAERRTGLAGGKMVDDDCWNTVRVEFRDLRRIPGVEAARVRTNGRDHLCTLPHRGIAPAPPTLGDIEIAIRSEFQSARILQATGKKRNGCNRGTRPSMRCQAGRRDGKKSESKDTSHPATSCCHVLLLRGAGDYHD